MDTGINEKLSSINSIVNNIKECVQYSIDNKEKEKLNVHRDGIKMILELFESENKKLEEIKNRFDQ